MDKSEVFKKFVEGSEILIVDKNPGSRTRLIKIICDLGAKRHMVHSASGIVEVENILKEKKISLVLSDYQIAGGSGFDLFNMLRSQDPNSKNLCLILVTSNISQTAVAKAAEEDVDSFIIKPYTLQSIQENLIATVCAKIQPSEYMLKIDEAKKLINLSELDGAMVILNEALKLHSKPALALFYMGQVEYLRNLKNEAQGSYQQGLGFNTIHFKCLVGLYDLFLKEKKLPEAYAIVKKIAKYFPANPDRLAQIIRLTVQTQNFKDMQSYYEVFTTLEERTSDMVNYIGAGMFISGKYFLKNNDPDVAMQFFNNIAVSCSEYTKFTRATIALLCEHKRVTDAEKFLKRFPASAKEHEDFLVSDFLVKVNSTSQPSSMVKKGLDLYNRQIRDYACMKMLIQAMEQSGYKEDKLARYKNEMEVLWPETNCLSA